MCWFEFWWFGCSWKKTYILWSKSNCFFFFRFYQYLPGGEIWSIVVSVFWWRYWDQNQRSHVLWSTPQKIKTWYHKKSISIKEILIFCKAHPLLVSKLLPMGARLCSASQTSKPLWSCQGVTLTVCHVWYPTSSNRSCFGCFPHSSPHPLVTWGHDAR